MPGRVMDWRIVATDISTRVLARAARGLYAERVVAPVPKHLRLKYMSRRHEGDGDLYEVKPELRSHVTFARMNLAEIPFPMRGPFDMVFCRNVMIYFDAGVRVRLVREIERLLRPGGLLVVGHSETLTGMGTGMRLLCPSVYRC